MEHFDILIIGGGPGGYVAAIRAAQLGKSVALVEKEHLGGVCLNWGCIPTKALLRSAEIIRNIKHARDYGIEVPIHNVNIQKIVERSRIIATNLASGIKHLLKKNNVTVYDGIGRISKNKTVIIGEKEVKADHIIIATGSRAKTLKGFEPNHKNIITVREAMTPETIPKSMIIIGSGAIGIEFASFYSSLGVDVTIVEAQNRILPAEDSEISEIAKKLFMQQSIKIHTSVKLLAQKSDANTVAIDLEYDAKLHSIKAEKLLVAIGVVGNTENLGLEYTKVEVKNGHIVTDQFMKTAEENIYAIGDVAGHPCLAHKASHEAILAVEAIVGANPHPLNKRNIPACTYSYPQIASVGLNEIAAKDAGYDVRIGKFPYAANGKALSLGESDGLIKTIFDAKTGELLGAHMIGAEVTELIESYVVAKNLEATELELIQTIFPHPTLSEMVHESVLAAYNRAIHI